MNPLLEEIRESPTLPEFFQDLQTLLSAEQQRRERFYAEISDDQKAEFVNGEVIMHSPATSRHLRIRDNLQRVLRLHVDSRELGLVAGEKARCVFPRNDYEPDVCFFGPAKAAAIQPETLKFPVPDFVAEVLSPSTERRDRTTKLRDYEAHGVREYWILDPDSEVLEQYALRGNCYELTLKSGSGEVSSVAVPGFTLPVRALFDDHENLAVLRRLLSAPLQ